MIPRGNTTRRKIRPIDRAELKHSHVSFQVKLLKLIRTHSIKIMYASITVRRIKFQYNELSIDWLIAGSLLRKHNAKGQIKYSRASSTNMIPSEPMLFENHIESNPRVAKFGERGYVSLPKTSLEYNSSVLMNSKAATCISML